MAGRKKSSIIAAGKKLTELEVKFCDAYLETKNAQQAYLDAGYAPSDANKKAYSLLKREHIKARIEKLMNDKAVSIGINKPFIISELVRIAESDLSIFNSFGQIDIDKIKNHPAISEVSFSHQKVKNDDGSEEVVSIISKVKLSGRLEALEKLGRVLGIYEKDNEQKKFDMNLGIIAVPSKDAIDEIIIDEAETDE